MVLKADQLRVKALLTETITLLCKNGLNYRSEFAIEALIGITLDKDDVFLISIKEKIDGGMGVLDAGDDSAQKRDFDIDISTAAAGGGGGDNFAAVEPSLADKHENSDGSESDASNSRTAPRKLFKSGQRRRRRRSNDMQANSQSEDSSAFALPDFDLEKALNDTENEPVTKFAASSDLGEERQDNEPMDKKPRVDDEDMGEKRVKEEQENEEDDDLIMVKEEAPTNIGSCTYQQSYPVADQTFSTGASSAPVFPDSMSWSSPSLYSTNSSPRVPAAGHGLSAASMQHTSTPLAQMAYQSPSALSQQANSSLSQSTASQGNTALSSQQFDLSQRKPFACTICGKKFSQLSWLQKHEDLHRGQYAYHCPVCAKGFSATSNLRGHMAKHTGIREHLCSLCGAAFSYSLQLKRHMEKHRRQMDAVLPPDVTAPSVNHM